MIITSAPGKTILFGEHAVVYDKLGIAGAVSLRSYVSVDKGNKEIFSKFGRWTYSESELYNLTTKIDNFLAEKDFDSIKKSFAPDMPIKYILGKVFEKYEFCDLTIKIESEVRKGLGSSSSIFAALSLALSKHLDQKLEKDEISNMAYHGDIAAHAGTPSGIDNNVATYGGFIQFKKSEGIKHLKIDNEIPLIIVDSGRPSTTSETVGNVRKLREEQPEKINPILEKIEGISKDAIICLQKNDLNMVGNLMNENHALLKQLGVSTEELDHIANIAVKNKALGAKLTGGGGGGCVIVLSDSNNLLDIFKEEGYEAFKVKIGTEGVRYERVNNS
jgi:mevalonate kinase